MLSCKLFNCLDDFADLLQGHEPIFPAEESAAGVTVPRGGLLPGYRSPLSPLRGCQEARHRASRFLPVRAWTAAMARGLIDVQLSGARLALLQDACRIAPGPRPGVRGQRVKRPRRSTGVRLPPWSRRRVPSQTPFSPSRCVET